MEEAEKQIEVVAEQSEQIRTILSCVHKRDGVLTASPTEDRTAELSFSSEVEYERMPNFFEVLSHEPNAVDLTRLNSGANLLFNHDSDKPIGVISSATIGADRKGRAVVRFSKSDFANQIWKDVQDGILRNVSVGYRIDEITRKGTRADGGEIYVASKWTPHEISVVTIPADFSVGVNRSIQVEEPKTNSNQKINTMSETPKPDAIAFERDRVRTILSAGKEYNSAELANEYVANGKSVEEFRSALLEIVNKRNQKVVDSTKPIGMSEKEIRNFSMVKLLRALSEPSNSKAREEARFELEMCEIAGNQQQRAVKGTVIPADVLGHPLSRADIVSIGGGAGYTANAGATVSTNLLTSSFIDLLRSKTTALQLATQLGGLVGSVDIPKQTSGTAGYWIGEDESATLQDVQFGLTELRNKTVASKSEITRKLLMQSSIDVEALVRADLAKGLAQTIDTAFFYGVASASTPKGIKNVAGINSFYWADTNKPTYEELIRMETEVEQNNIDSSTARYVMNAKMRGYLKGAKKFATSGADSTIWEQGNTVNGYGTEVTNQINDGDIFFADWSQAIVGLWGNLEIIVDPYSGSDRGRLKIVAMQDVDFAVRYNKAFTYGFID